jgi:hypothetical protein
MYGVSNLIVETWNKTNRLNYHTFSILDSQYKRDSDFVLDSLSIKNHFLIGAERRQ